MNKWFRFYSEALNDHKVQSLSPELFKTWINLLCVANSNGGMLPGVDKLAFDLRVSKQDMQSRLDDLILAGLIDIRPDKTLEPHNWCERQFTSDSSVERTRKYRERLKKKPCDVTVTPDVTPPEAEADTETDSEKHFAPENQPDRRSDVFNILGSLNGRGSRGVSPRLKERAEGLGLPVDEIERRALANDVREPNAMFRHVASERLQAMLPMADRRVLKAALTKSDAAYAQVCQLLLEAT